MIDLISIDVRRHSIHSNEQFKHSGLAMDVWEHRAKPSDSHRLCFEKFSSVALQTDRREAHRMER
jgi:hypothetical protein